MIALAGGAVLHDTSKVLHHYPEDRYVAAGLELFASVALMFWYMPRLYLSRRERDGGDGARRGAQPLALRGVPPASRFM
jgi:hypothetical protein